eukprot:gb/GECG01002654.1/.p1 GENE.gb/GECG01002654.1/~~gb/GECG01002654.1/.p1  ORF type:complete len:241 (+),score=32.91 gb/GECG01002654.1/:1-723(+)
MQLVEHATRNITLGLKDHIDSLDFTEEPRNIWRRIHDRIMSTSPVNVYEEEGLACGMAIVKVCMRGDVGADGFSAKQLLDVLGYDQDLINQAIVRYRSEAVSSMSSGSGTEASVTASPISQSSVYSSHVDERVGRLEQEIDAVKHSQVSRSELESLQAELDRVRGVARTAKEMAEKNQTDGDIGSGSTVQQQLPAPGTSTGQSIRDEMDTLHSHIDQLSRRLNDVMEVAFDNRERFEEEM